MPMGFYQPAQIVIDARKHGVEILPVDVNHSYWDNTLEERTGKYHKIRLGFRQVKGLKEEEMNLLAAGRYPAYHHIHALSDVGISMAALEKLADADAFRSMGLDRRQALWETSALSDRPVGMFQGQPSASATEAPIPLPKMTASEHVLQDYSSMSLSLKAHPVSFVRKHLFAGGILCTKELDLWPDGTPVRVAGLVLVRQRPGTASGICFITIEDETGSANLVVFKDLFDKYRKEIVRSRLLMVEGKLQREGEVTHVIAKHCYDMSGLLTDLSSIREEDPLAQTLSHADEKDGEVYQHKSRKVSVSKVIQGEIFPSGRNFK